MTKDDLLEIERAVERALVALGTDGYRARLDYTNVWRRNAQEAVNQLRAAQNRVAARRARASLTEKG